MKWISKCLANISQFMNWCTLAEPTDYPAVIEKEIIFPRGSVIGTLSCTTVDIVNDNDREAEETFLLNGALGTDTAVEVGAVTTIVIVDDDSAFGNSP